MADDPETILEVLVGSRAHGLARDDSDYDYRRVFLVPTCAFHSLAGSVKSTQWIEKTDEGTKDDTAWELGHFLHLAQHCNPTILEVFAAPVQRQTGLGAELRELFPKLWHPKRVADAFIGYATNQQKKLLKEGERRLGMRARKYAMAHYRVLIQGDTLLRTGVLPIDFSGDEFLRSVRDGAVSVGDVIDRCVELAEQVTRAMNSEVARRQVPDLEAVDRWLQVVRHRNFWRVYDVGQPF